MLLQSCIPKPYSEDIFQVNIMCFEEQSIYTLYIIYSNSHTIQALAWFNFDHKLS